MFGACYLMKLNVIITCFVFSFSMCYLVFSFFLKFYITLTISFRRKKNHSNVMTNFIFCLSTSRHRLNQVDLNLHVMFKGVSKIVKIPCSTLFLQLP